jgi:hypothetical protein
MTLKRSELKRKTPMKRGSATLARVELRRSAPKPRSKAISPATPEQRAKVRERACVVCSNGPCDPAHLVDRSLAPSAGDDRRAVVPLCRRCHDLYDAHKLDLSPHLEPHYREEIAWAVEAVGLFPALKRITGSRWAPVGETA